MGLFDELPLSFCLLVVRFSGTTLAPFVALSIFFPSWTGYSPPKKNIGSALVVGQPKELIIVLRLFRCWLYKKL